MLQLFITKFIFEKAAIGWTLYLCSHSRIVFFPFFKVGHLQVYWKKRSEKFRKNPRKTLVFGILVPLGIESMMQRTASGKSQMMIQQHSSTAD